MASADATIDGYLAYLRDVRRMSPNTIESYARDLAALAAFAEKQGRAVEALERRDLEAFARHLMSGRPVAALGRPRHRLHPRVLSFSAARETNQRRSRRGPARAARMAGAAQVSRPRRGRSAAARSPIRRRRGACATRR